MAAPLAAAASRPPTIDLGKEIGSIEVIRCHFTEDRFVVRFDDTLHVLRAGDRLEAADLTVVEISESSATLTHRPAGSAGSLRLIRLTDNGNGAIAIRELSTDPEAVSEAATAAKAAIATRQGTSTDTSSDN